MQVTTNQEAIDDRTMRIERADVVGSGYIQFPPQKAFSEQIEVQPPTVSHEALPEMYNSGRTGYAAPGRQSAQVPYAPRPAGAASYAPRPTAASARPAPQQTAPSHATSRSGSGMRGAYSPATGGYATPQNGRGDAPRGNGYASANGSDPSAGHSYRGPAPARGAGMASGRGGRGTTGRGPSQNMARQGGTGEAPMQHRSASGGGGGAAPMHSASGRGRGGGYAQQQQQRPVMERAPAQPQALAARPLVQARPAAPRPAAPAPQAPPSLPGSNEGDGVLTRSQLKRLRKKKRDGKA